MVKLADLIDLYKRDYILFEKTIKDQFPPNMVATMIDYVERAYAMRVTLDYAHKQLKEMGANYASLNAKKFGDVKDHEVVLYEDGDENIYPNSKMIVNASELRKRNEVIKQLSSELAPLTELIPALKDIAKARGVRYTYNQVVEVLMDSRSLDAIKKYVGE